MEAEASAIARKLTNYFEISNKPKKRNRLREVTLVKSQPGMIAHMTMVALMGLAVVFTELSLILVQWAKKLES